MPETNCDGYNERFNTSKACTISVAKKSKDDNECLIKHCEEYVIIHELLHCKPWLSHYAENKGSPTACYLDQVEHTLLDEMAKSLLMSKYNLTLDWFKNF